MSISSEDKNWTAIEKKQICGNVFSNFPQINLSKALSAK